MISHKYSALRWIFLSVALIVLLWITYMNIQYVDTVREANQDAFTEKKREQVREFVSLVRTKFITVPRSIWNVDSESLKYAIEKKGVLPDEAAIVLKEVLNDSLYLDVYFTTNLSGACETTSTFWQFDKQKGSFFKVSAYPELVCDGLNLAQTRMKVLMDDYKWNTKTTFDTHRSMNIAIMYPPERKVLGYLVVVLNSDYIVNTYLKNEINRLFGENSDDLEVTLWINDWIKEQVLYTNNSTLPLDFKKVQFVERFPGLFDNWNVLVYVHKPKNQELVEFETAKNLIILILSVVLLIVSLLFIIYSAKKEQEISKRQSEFLSNVTHELKTPLAVIQAAGENLKDRRVKNEDRVANYGKHIYDEAVRLKTMIEKLLDIARSDTNLTKISPEKLNPVLTMETVLQREFPVLQSKGFLITKHYDHNELYITADRGHLETIITNLIENSVKYSRDQFALDLYIGTKNNKVVIQISDKGIGIPKSALPHIFEKFYRVEDSLTAHTKGHGLGLSIVKHLVELNYGSISVESQYNKGSSFSIEFPLTQSNESSQNKNYNDLKSNQYAELESESVI